MMQTANMPESRNPHLGVDAEQSDVLMTVCIEALTNGLYQVRAMNDQEQGEMQTDEPQNASSLDEALDIARSMLQQEAGEPDEAAPGAGNEPMDPQSAQSYWDQLAAKKGRA